jgi:hypothetical protein
MYQHVEDPASRHANEKHERDMRAHEASIIETRQRELRQEEQARAAVEKVIEAADYEELVNLAFGSQPSASRTAVWCLIGGRREHVTHDTRRALAASSGRVVDRLRERYEQIMQMKVNWEDEHERELRNARREMRFV